MNKHDKSSNQLIVEHDLLRYKKNKLASTLALLGLVFNCLYFMILYAMPKEQFQTYQIGFSVIITLVVMLMIFLSSEGVKGYNKKFAIVLLVIAALQILRIFGYPLMGIKENALIGDLTYGAEKGHRIGYFGIYPTTSTMFFVLMVVYLTASAACLIASAVIGYIYAVRLENFQRKVDNGEININETIDALDREDAEKAAEAEVAEEENVSADSETVGTPGQEEVE